MKKNSGEKGNKSLKKKKDRIYDLKMLVRILLTIIFVLAFLLLLIGTHTFFDKFENSHVFDYLGLAFILLLIVFLILLWIISSKIAKNISQNNILEMKKKMQIISKYNGTHALFFDIEKQVFEKEDSLEITKIGNIIDNENKNLVSIESIRAYIGNDIYDAYKYRIYNNETVENEDILAKQEDGKEIWYKVSAEIINDEKGKPLVLVVTYYDNTKRKEKEIYYNRSLKHIEKMIENNIIVIKYNLTKDILISMDTPDMFTDSGFQNINSRFEFFVNNYVYEEDKKAMKAFMNRDRLISQYFNGTNKEEMCYRYIQNDGVIKWHKCGMIMLTNPSDDDIMLFVTHMDIDEEKKKELEIIKRAQSDQLTGAFNRTTFISKFEELLHDAPNNNHALLMIDFDDFKGINDNYGHNAGDLILKTLYQNIKPIIREKDIIGRLGGDEFFIGLNSINQKGAKVIASRLCESLRWKLDNEKYATVSIGVAIYPKDGKTFEELYANVDKALYTAKKNGKKTYALYNTNNDDVINSLNDTINDCFDKTDQSIYQKVLENTQTYVVIYDVANDVFTFSMDYTNSPFSVYDNYFTRNTMINKGILSKEDSQKITNSIRYILSGEKEKDETLIKIKGKDNKWKWYRIYSSKIDGFNELNPKIILAIKDINNEMLNIQKVEYLETHDKLTGLINRETFFLKAKKMIDEHEPGYYVISCINIDNFKLINDQYGTEVGNSVLIRIAKAFTEISQKIGALASRSVSDHFAIIYPVKYIRSKIISDHHEYLRNKSLPNKTIKINIGKYIITDKNLSINSMYDRSLIAMKSLKGKLNVYEAIYDETMRDAIVYDQYILDNAKEALSNKEFKIWIQPQFNINNNNLIGGEVLVRWIHPSDGIIPPDKFIPLFERSGFIYEMDKYVWEQACILLNRWEKEKKKYTHLSINISRFDLLVNDFYDVITSLIEKYQINIDSLHLEITESTFADDDKNIFSIVKKLADYGFIIELDDFGKGYSSLNALNRLPVDIIKLDRSFLFDVNKQNKNEKILSSVVRMAKWQGMPVIAEGVETIEHADFLKHIGCDYVQGFLYAKPMPVQNYEIFAEKYQFGEYALNTPKDHSSKFKGSYEMASLDMFVFSDYAGAAFTVEYYNRKLEIMRANSACLKEMHWENAEESDLLSLNIRDYLLDDSLKNVYECVKKAILNNQTTSTNIKLYPLYKKLEPNTPINQSDIQYFHLTFRIIEKLNDRVILYCSFYNREGDAIAKENANSLEIENKLYDDIVKIISAPKSKVNMLYSMLKLIREYFDGTRIYLYEVDNKKRTYKNKYSDFIDQKDSEHASPKIYDPLQEYQWVDAFRQVDYLILPVEEPTEDFIKVQNALFEVNNVQKIFSYAIKKDGDVKIIISVDDPKINLENLSPFGTIERVLFNLVNQINYDEYKSRVNKKINK